MSDFTHTQNTDSTQHHVVTVSPAWGEQTFETCQTCFPKNNREFLTAIFGDAETEAKPMVTGFAGDPQDQQGRVWAGWPLSAQAATDNPAWNAYFTLATYKSTDGRYKRREDACVCVHGLMLDDVGTKALPRDQLKLPPSYLIETSPQNFQAGYLFDEPQTDLKQVTALHNAIVAKKMCDWQAKSPTTRWGRLPYAVNGKATCPADWQVRLVEWHPELRYTIQQITDGLELSMQAVPPTPGASARHPAPPRTQRAAGVTGETLKELRSALLTLDATDRELWVAVGNDLADKALGGEGRELWIEWSMSSPAWRDGDEAKWDSFKPTRSGYKSVFSKAQKCGWVNPAKGKRPPTNSAQVDFDDSVTVEDVLGDIEAQNSKRSRRADAIDRNTDGDVHVPRAKENPVIAELKKRGLYKQPQGSGKHEITCPWVHEHEDEADHSTIYFEPSPSFPIGGFRCKHDHREPKRIGALLADLDVTIEAAKHKPIIRAKAGELHRVVDACEQELANTGRYFQRGGLIASIVTDPETKATRIKPTEQNALMRALSGLAIWMIWDGRSKEDKVCDPPTKHVMCLLGADSYDHLPPLSGLARQPHLRTNGTLVTEPGYDAQTGLFGVFDGSAFNVPATPTRSDAEAALDLLQGLLSEFAFPTASDHSAALAGMLTAAIRPSLPTAPMMHINAPQPGSGKSYLCSIIAAFNMPGSVAATSFPVSDEECQKQLLSLLLEAPGVVMFDNLTRDLEPFKTLCSVLTEEHLTDRLLGYSKSATVSTRTMFLSSGNNVSPARDMTRRTVTITLDPKVEFAASRKFSGNPLSTVRADRGRYVSAALTIIRAWICAGAPVTDCPALNSYDQWTAWIRQPLLWLGQPDPVQRVFDVMAHDPDRETLARLVHAWQAAFGRTPTMVRQAVEHAERNDFGGTGAELGEAMREIAEERGIVNRRRFGKWLSKHAGRVVDGLRFEKAKGSAGAELWRIVQITPPKPQEKQVCQVLQVNSPQPAETVTAHAGDDVMEF